MKNRAKLKVVGANILKFSFLRFVLLFRVLPSVSYNNVQNCFLSPTLYINSGVFKATNNRRWKDEWILKFCAAICFVEALVHICPCGCSKHSSGTFILSFCDWSNKYEVKKKIRKWNKKNFFKNFRSFLLFFFFTFKSWEY